MIDQKQYRQVMAKCVRDHAFKQHLLADPRETLRQEGVELPIGVTIKVAEDTPDVINLVIPAVSPDWNEEMSAGQTWGTLDTPRPINSFFWDGD